MSYQVRDDKIDRTIDRALKGHLTHDGLVDPGKGVLSNFFCRSFPKIVKAPSMRSGDGIRKDELHRWVAMAKWAISTEGALMNVTEQLNQQYDAAAKIWADYEDRLKNFRGQVKNDCASLAAQARGIDEASKKMNAAFNETVRVLNSEEMNCAIANAERLASALTSLNSLASHKIMFATVGNKSESSREDN